MTRDALLTGPECWRIAAEPTPIEAFVPAIIGALIYLTIRRLWGRDDGD